MPPHAFRRGVRNATQPLVGWVTAEASRLYRRTTAPPSMAKLAADGGAPAGVTHVLFDMDGLLLGKVAQQPAAPADVLRRSLWDGASPWCLRQAWPPHLSPPERPR